MGARLERRTSAGHSIAEGRQQQQQEREDMEWARWEGKALLGDQKRKLAGAQAKVVELQTQLQAKKPLWRWLTAML
jgi:hypothetical protein